MFKKRWKSTILGIIVGTLLFAACQQASDAVPIKATPIVIETFDPQPESVIPKNLSICMSQEPDTLYPYGSNMLVKTAVQVAIFETEITTFSYDYQARGLEKLPSLTDGDAILNTIVVKAGELVLDASENPVELTEGISVINADGEVVRFNGDPITMKNITVDFTLKPRIWSDGQPVKASDSVFSFQIASHPDTPSDKFVIERTANYEATGDLTLRWTGIPGFFDPTYFTNIWQPLPEHNLGKFTPSELLEVDEANRMPVGDGPFMVEEWDSGGIITLVPNPYYYRQDEGLPYLDSVAYKYSSYSWISSLLSGACDIITQDGLTIFDVPFLIEAENADLLTANIQLGPVWEHIDFGINSYGDYANYRPDWFEDVRVRQAMTMCTDRQQMVDEITYGQSEVLHSYISSTHPLYPQEGFTEWPYDVEAANALLDEVGFVDNDGDGIREYTDGTPFTVTLSTTSNRMMRAQINKIFRENMLNCGIMVELYFMSPNEWVPSDPESPLLGRRFDLDAFAWGLSTQPSCQLYLTSAITGPIEEGFAGWKGTNNIGWSNDAYDKACNKARSSLVGTSTYTNNHKEALRIFSQETPTIPLFQQLIVAVTRPEILNFSVDPTGGTELQNIYMFDIEQ